MKSKEEIQRAIDDLTAIVTYAEPKGEGPKGERRGVVGAMMWVLDQEPNGVTGNLENVRVMLNKYRDRQ